MTSLSKTSTKLLIGAGVITGLTAVTLSWYMQSRRPRTAAAKVMDMVSGAHRNVYVR